jgi:predicted transcriptional regulator
MYDVGKLKINGFVLEDYEERLYRAIAEESPITTPYELHGYILGDFNKLTQTLDVLKAANVITSITLYPGFTYYEPAELQPFPLTQFPPIFSDGLISAVSKGSVERRRRKHRRHELSTRGARILSYLEGCNDDLTVDTICRDLKLPKSSVVEELEKLLGIKAIKRYFRNFEKGSTKKPYRYYVASRDPMYPTLRDSVLSALKSGASTVKEVLVFLNLNDKKDRAVIANELSLLEDIGLVNVVKGAVKGSTKPSNHYSIRATLETH